MNLLQRTVDISVKGVTQGGVMTGQLYVGNGEKRRDFGIEMVTSGLSNVDQRKLDYDEVPKIMVDAYKQAKRNRLGIWSLEQKEEVSLFSLYMAKKYII